MAAVPEGLPAIVTIALAIGVRRMARATRLSPQATGGRDARLRQTVICTDKTGTLTTGIMKVREMWGADHRRLIERGAACCDAELATAIGDTTELAILAEAALCGIERAAIELGRPRDALPFDAGRRRMSTRVGRRALREGCGRGCPAGLHRWHDGANEAATHLAARGLRVLGSQPASARPMPDSRLLGLISIAL